MQQGQENGECVLYAFRSLPHEDEVQMILPTKIVMTTTLTF